jgi:hypothetical protein
MPRNTPVWFTATTRSQTSSSVSVIVAQTRMPALFTSTSTRPRSSTTWSTTAVHCSGDVTSCSRKVAPMPDAVALPSSTSRSVR